MSLSSIIENKILDKLNELSTETHRKYLDAAHRDRLNALTNNPLTPVYRVDLEGHLNKNPKYNEKIGNDPIKLSYYDSKRQKGINLSREKIARHILSALKDKEGYQ